MFLELFLGNKYLRSRHKKKFINFNTGVSIFCIIIGVAVLIIVLSVMNGFQSKIRDTILNIDYHIVVTSRISRSGDKGIKDYEKLANSLLRVNGIISVHPFFQGEAILKSKYGLRGVEIRGITDKRYISIEFKKTLIKGKFILGKKYVIIGSELASDNALKVGDSITLIVPSGGSITQKYEKPPVLKKLQISGIFKTGYYKFDSNRVYTSLENAQDLYQIGKIAYGIGIYTDNVYKDEQISQMITELVGYDYWVFTWMDLNRNLYSALNTEKTIMSLILFLIIIVAAINILSTIVMYTMEKRHDIAILKSLGMSNTQIIGIFVWISFYLGLVGTVFGSIFGVLGSLYINEILNILEKLISFFVNNFTFFDTSTFYMNKIPIELNYSFIILISIITVLISVVAGILPAKSASKNNIIESLKEE